MLEQIYQGITTVAEISDGTVRRRTTSSPCISGCVMHGMRWMMVLDNADDDGIFLSSKTPPNEFILITTRNGPAARIWDGARWSCD
jgi:hypothetical protein